MFHFSSTCYNVINWFPPSGRLCVAKTSLFVTCSIATGWVEVAIALVLRATLPQLAKVIFNETPLRGVVKVNQALEKVKKRYILNRAALQTTRGGPARHFDSVCRCAATWTMASCPDPMSDLECSSSLFAFVIFWFTSESGGGILNQLTVLMGTENNFQIDGVYFSWYRTGKKM